MDFARTNLIVEEARRVLNGLWKRRAEIWLNPPATAEDLCPIPTDIIISEYLGVRYEEPEEILSLASLKQELVGTETAGFIDRDIGKIVIAQKFKVEWRRFTAAHEIGHWILHPANKLHRDIPITGAERANPSLPPEEQEANLFAAELLMPRRILSQVFLRHFGGQIDGREPNEDLAFWISAGSKRNVDQIELAKRGVRYRALLIAQLSSYRGKHFVPLADRFGVSPTAMAIQLEVLGLVR